ICHEQDSCPLKPVTETILIDKSKDKSLGKLTSGKELTLSAPPPAPQPSSNGRIPPSWWRPDLVKPSHVQEDTTTLDYRRKKAKGKQIVNANSKQVCRLDNTRSQNRIPPGKERYPNHHSKRDDSHGFDRRGTRSSAPIPRSRETRSKTLGSRISNSTREIPSSRDSGRKRRFDDTLENHHRKTSSSKERAVTLGKNNDKPQPTRSKFVGLSLASDSQLTVLDPLMNVPCKIHVSLISTQSPDKDKSSYDQTVGEEEKEAREALLETRFSKAIQIEGDPSATPEAPDFGAGEMETEIDGTWEEEEDYMNEDIND
ncbi:unnamed protein product, partial [Arabidopsis halleri]